jgi:hypothetical protein
VNAVRMRRVDGKKEFKVPVVLPDVVYKLMHSILIGFRIRGVC